MKWMCLIGSFLFLMFIILFCIVKSYGFSIGCSGHLRRASNANTIEIAKVELKTAISYLEVNELTSGFVSIFMKQPKNDIGFFYNNLKASMNELENISPEASQLEKSNMLMKLRESLTDNSENGTRIIHPSELCIYPHNALIWFGSIFFTIVFVISLISISSRY